MESLPNDNSNNFENSSSIIIKNNFIDEQFSQEKLSQENKSKCLATKSNTTRIRVSHAENNLKPQIHKNVESQIKLKEFLDSSLLSLFMSFVTLFVLFGNDIKIMVFTNYADSTFDIIYTFFFVIYLVEIFLLCIADKSYFLSFFFFLDLIATLSLILEIEWIFKPIINEIVESGESTGNASANAKNIVRKATNTSRITRVLRVVRLIRLLRVVKLYKSALVARKKIKKIIDRGSSKTKGQYDPTGLIEISSKKQVENDFLSESNISKVISVSITQKLIAIIMIMSVVMPILSEETYFSDDKQSYKVLTEYFCNFPTSSVSQDDFPELWYFLNEYDKNEPIVNITVNDLIIYANVTETSKEFRESELNYAYSLDGKCSITFSVKFKNFLESLFNFISTLVTCIILIVASLLFESDTKRLVLDPLEVMIEIVEKVEKDPINCKNAAEMEEGIKSLLMKINNPSWGTSYKVDEKYEVVMIKKAILKISGLLAVGFGEAGSDIIRENLKQTELNPMIEGKKIEAIFCFVEIRLYQEIVKKLGRRCVLLTNEIAWILHRAVDKFYGYPNRNLGDVFINLWKINSHNKLTLQQASNLALMFYIEAVNEINNSVVIKSYLYSLGNTKLSLGFGFHFGWAIEGAIGSTHKIDASYLSSNVNLAARLEAATKQYGVNILISEDIFNNLEQELKNLSRLIDVVNVKGSKKQMKLYTLDCAFVKDLPLVRISKEDHEVAKGLFQENYKASGLKVLADAFKSEPYCKILKKPADEKFFRNFQKGVNCYLVGDWESSKELLSNSLGIKKDGPTKTLLKFMQSNNYEVPEDWKGFRELMNK